MDLQPSFVENFKDDTLLYIYYSNDRAKERPTITKTLLKRGLKYYPK